MKKQKAVSVYMTASSREEGEKLARVLVEKRVVACVNVIPGVISIYRWEGKLETADEVSLIAKTTQSQLPTLLALVKSEHSYSVPCVVTWPILGGNSDYLKWIEKETAPKSGKKKSRASIGR